MVLCGVLETIDDWVEGRSRFTLLVIKVKYDCRGFDSSPDLCLHWCHRDEKKALFFLSSHLMQDDETHKDI